MWRQELEENTVSCPYQTNSSVLWLKEEGRERSGREFKGMVSSCKVRCCSFGIRVPDGVCTDRLEVECGVVMGNRLAQSDSAELLV
jgi:hypothetical protein